MKANKTLPTKASVKSFIESISDERRREETQILIGLMGRASGEPATMWGPSIIGFGSQHYRYESGREGDQLIVGFSPRKAAISIYGLSHALSESQLLLEKLGPYTTGKGCIYLKRLENIDLKLLEKIVKKAFALNKKQIPHAIKSGT